MKERVGILTPMGEGLVVSVSDALGGRWTNPLDGIWYGRGYPAGVQSVVATVTYARSNIFNRDIGGHTERIEVAFIFTLALDPVAPVDGTCRECYEWRSYPAGQVHFGYAWWKTCSWTCEHQHHVGEIWMAS